MTDPYAEFDAGQVMCAEHEIAHDKLASALGREVIDEDILIWLRARRAYIVEPKPPEYCEIRSRGPALWCGEKGKFVQYFVLSGPHAGQNFESTEKDFAEHWAPAAAAIFRAKVRP